MLSIIAAIGKNRELGKDNKLLWHLASDMKRFKKLTEGHVVIMGRKTFESLPEKYRPLPNRVNIVITRQNLRTNLKRPRQDCSVFFVSSIEEAIEKGEEIVKKENLSDEIFVIGGANVYSQAIKYADKIYLTIIDKDYPQADVFFPEYQNIFKKIIYNEKKQENELNFEFIELLK